MEKRKGRCKGDRDVKGRYDFGNMDLMCVCGHTLGVHAGWNDTRTRECFNSDPGCPGATGEKCDCKNFTKAKKQNGLIKSEYAKNVGKV